MRAIVVGHAHYDHAMDIPYIAVKKAPQASIYGSHTLVRVLAPLADQMGTSNPLISLEDQALCRIENPSDDPCAREKDPCAQTGPVPLAGSRRFRLWPITSEHSPQLGPGLVLGPFRRLAPFAPVTLWRGQLLVPARTLPSRAGGWPTGTVLAYVIELLNESGKDAVFRIYYQDSPTRRPIGYPPRCVGRIDLALLCVGGATELQEFPQDIVAEIKPKFVMGAHWEDFFNPRPLPLPGQRDVKESIRPVAGVKVEAFLKAVGRVLPAGGQATVPCPEAVTYFQRDGEGWKIVKTTASWESRRGRLFSPLARRHERDSPEQPRPPGSKPTAPRPRTQSAAIPEEPCRASLRAAIGSALHFGPLTVWVPGR